MKKLLLLSMICFMLVSSVTFADSMKAMVWKDYGFTFSVPNAMADNAIADAKYYSANDGSMYMYIYPWKDASVTAEQMGEKAIKTMEGWNWVDSVARDGEARKLDWNGFKGSQIFGTITTDASVAVKYTAIGIIDPGSANNYFAIIYWNSKKSIDKEYYEKAAKILTSFKMEAKKTKTVNVQQDAGGMKAMVWDDYNFNFSLPYAMANNEAATATSYSANDGKMYMFIYPWKDASLTAEQMGEVAIKTMEGWNWVDSVARDGKARALAWNGFKGSQIFGTITTDASVAVKYTAIGLIDPNSENNFFAIIYWNSKKTIDTEYYNTAAKILTTFKIAH